MSFTEEDSFGEVDNMVSLSSLDIVLVSFMSVYYFYSTNIPYLGMFISKSKNLTPDV